MEDWLLHLLEPKSRDGLDNLSDAFCRLTCANRNPYGGPAPDDVGFLSQIYKRPEGGKGRTPAHTDGHREQLDWQDHVGRILSQRRFVITEKGRLGLVHPTAKKGDEVVILFGCSVPVVLCGSDKIRVFKGDAYIQDCMRGEVPESAPEKDGGYSRIKGMGREWHERWFRGLETEPADNKIGDETAPKVFRIM